MASKTERTQEFDLSVAQFRFLANLAYERTGIVLADQKRDMVYGRLVRRLRALKLCSFAQYCELLEGPQGHNEVGQLINAITTNLTGFFRETHHFEHLHQTLSERGKHPGRLRLWSSACSSGMEPYSMAMVLRHAIPTIDKWDAKILATDIDTAMLETGKTGVYRTSDVEKVPPVYHTYMAAEGAEHVSMEDSLRKMLAFKKLNLLESWPMKGLFDIIFCRNVVIYFDKPTKTQLFERMADILTPGGLLYIGHSENLHGISDRFELVGRTIYRKVT